MYERADILSATLEEAVQTIVEFRSGRRPGLGDWTSVIHHFDPFRDGRAGRRIRAALDYLMTGDESKVSAAGLADGVAASCGETSAHRPASSSWILPW